MEAHAINQDDTTNERLGLRCPTRVFDEVNADAAASAPGRREAVLAKDLRDDKNTRAALCRVFPRMPIETAEIVLEHGFQKGSGRVGRSTTFDEDRKVEIAVEAHIRHNFTNYDTLLRGSASSIGRDSRREAARTTVKPLIQNLLSQWRATFAQGTASTTENRSSKSTTNSNGKLLTMAASAIIGDDVTRDYHISQPASNSNGINANMVQLDASIHAISTPIIPTQVDEVDSDQPIDVLAVTAGVSKASTGAEFRKRRTRSSSANEVVEFSDESKIIIDVVNARKAIDLGIQTPVAAMCSSPIKLGNSFLLESDVHVEKIGPRSLEKALEVPTKPARLTSNAGQVPVTSTSQSTSSYRKRVHEVEEDVPPMKRPRRQAAIVAERIIHQKQHSGPAIRGSSDDNLPMEFNSLCLNEVTASNQDTNNTQQSGHFTITHATTTMTRNRPDTQKRLESEDLDISISRRVAEVWESVRQMVLEHHISSGRKQEDRARKLPQRGEHERIKQIKDLMTASIIDSNAVERVRRKWQSNRTIFHQFSNTEQRFMVLAEFKKQLLSGRIDHNLKFVEHGERGNPSNFGSSQRVNVQKEMTTEERRGFENFLNIAHENYRKVKNSPHFENSLSEDERWAAWQTFEFGEGDSGTGCIWRNVQRYRECKPGAFKDLLDNKHVEKPGNDGDISTLGYDESSDDCTILSERPVLREPPNVLSSLVPNQQHYPRWLDGFEGLDQSAKHSLNDTENSFNPPLLPLSNQRTHSRYPKGRRARQMLLSFPKIFHP